jgi:hypothetical protein
MIEPPLMIWRRIWPEAGLPGCGFNLFPRVFTDVWIIGDHSCHGLAMHTSEAPDRFLSDAIAFPARGCTLGHYRYIEMPHP